MSDLENIETMDRLLDILSYDEVDEFIHLLEDECDIIDMIKFIMNKELRYKISISDSIFEPVGRNLIELLPDVIKLLRDKKLKKLGI